MQVDTENILNERRYTGNRPTALSLTLFLHSFVKYVEVCGGPGQLPQLSYACTPESKSWIRRCVRALYRHLCMVMRGVQKMLSKTVTSSMFGEFRQNPKSRAEFMSLINRD